ncbi:hypothetical protein IPH92_02140 [Candidatus Kaiserbacteria bacterium]|nr:MAG: hypothetical protein IPH92_02140 [Candidatus Kaiserbacteria bacterium]
MKEPLFLNKQEVEKIFLDESSESKSEVLSYIDMGFSRNGDTEESVPNQISDIKIYFYVSNNSQRFDRFTINTGIQKGTLNYIRIEGATGYKWENDELVIAYVPLSAGDSTVVTVTALPLISEKPLEIKVSPVVKNREGSVMNTGSIKNKTIYPTSSSNFKEINTRRLKQNISDIQ